MIQFIAIAAGGGLGSLVRFLIGHWLYDPDILFPRGTFIANTLSCLILGVFVSWAMDQQWSDAGKGFWLIGFCGGFSTFSSFTHETFQLIQLHEYGMASLNILLSLIVCIVSLFIGFKLGGLV